MEWGGQRMEYEAKGRSRRPKDGVGGQRNGVGGQMME